MLRIALICSMFVCLAAAACAQGEDEQTLRREMEGLRRRIEELERQAAPEAAPQQVSQAAEKKDSQQAAEKKSDVLHIHFLWNEGPDVLSFQTEDKALVGKIGGRTYTDCGFVHEDDAIERNLGEMEDYAEMRSVRLRVSATLYERFLFKTEIEFSEQLRLYDVYVGVAKVLFDDDQILVGHFREPFGLETLSSRYFQTFLELGAPFALIPDRNIGIAYTSRFEDRRITCSIGCFREVTEDFPKIRDDGGSYAGTMRITGLPYYEDKGRELLHLGLAYSYRNPRNDQIRYRSRAENSTGPWFVDTGNLVDVEDNHLVGAEAAFVYGPFCLQGEFAYSWVRPDEETAAFPDTQEFWGCYVFASFFVTGENRRYRKAEGAFDQGLDQQKSIFAGDSIGAVELLARYSRLDLQDDVEGRRMDNLTLGVNWHLSANLRIMTNYIYSMIHDVADSDRTDAHILAFRVHMNF